MIAAGSFSCFKIDSEKGAGTSLSLQTSETDLPANGIATATVTAKLISAKNKPVDLSTLNNPVQFYIDSGVGLVKLIGPFLDPNNRNQVNLVVQAKMIPGVVWLVARSEFAEEIAIELTIVPDWTDSDNDGFPDVVELNDELDRQSFLKWFVTVAEAQFYQPSDYWHQEQRDCAGLIRFAYREALKQHSENWFKKVPLTQLEPISDVQKYNYPKVPLLEQNIFRKSDLSIGQAAIDSIFTNFVETRYIMNNNCIALGKDRLVSRSGDLVFFFHFDDPNMPLHSMVFIKDQINPAQDRFIYHTGPDDFGRAEVRKLDRQTLDRHPDPRWRPEMKNPYFLGYYRWKIVS